MPSWPALTCCLATYQYPGHFHHTSGDPFARQVRFTGGRTIPFIVLNVDPIGTYRRPHLNVVTVRVERRFTMPRAQTATVTLNLYNALNANTVTALQNRSGASFLQPLAILPPRLAEISWLIASDACRLRSPVYGLRSCRE